MAAISSINLETPRVDLAGNERIKIILKSPVTAIVLSIISVVSVCIYASKRINASNTKASAEQAKTVKANKLLVQARQETTVAKKQAKEIASQAELKVKQAAVELKTVKNEVESLKKKVQVFEEEIRILYLKDAVLERALLAEQLNDAYAEEISGLESQMAESFSLMDKLKRRVYSRDIKIDSLKKKVIEIKRERDAANSRQEIARAAKYRAQKEVESLRKQLEEKSIVCKNPILSKAC